MKERMSNMGKRIWEDRKYQIMAFFVCLGSFYLYYSWMTVIKGGNSFLLSGDTFALYIPSVRQFFRDLMDGENLGFSWNNGFGMNTVPLYTSCVGGSIFSLFFLFLYKVDPAIVLTVVIALKVALTGACFTYFIERVTGKKGEYTVAFALLYAMSGVQMTICIQNYLWMDAEYILPVLIAFIIEFFKTGRWGRLLFTYAYLFLCSYIAAYVVGFFSALVFFAYMIGYVKEKKAIHAFKYIGVVFGAAGLCAFALLPTAIFLLTKMAPDASSQTELHLDLSRVLNGFMMGKKFEMDIQQPYFYTGMLSFVLLPLYFLSKKISRKEKCICGIILFIMFISCLNPGLYMFWHGFNAPDGWYYRFSYVVTFVIATIACIVWEREFACDGKKIVAKDVILSGLIGLSTIILLGILLIREQGFNNSKNILVLSFAFAVIWGFIICINVRKTEIRKGVCHIIVFLCALEVIVNSCCYMPNKLSDQRYNNYMEVGERAVQILKQDKDFYRVNFTNCRNWNWDSFFGIKGNSDFGTLENYEVRRTLGNLGAYTSSRLTLSYGQNPLTQLIMGVKYNIKGKDDLQNDVTMDGRVTCYNYYLGLGFLVDGAIENLNFSVDGNIYDNCNQMASAMTGIDITLFRPYDISKVGIMLDNMNMEYQDNQYCFKILEPGKIGQATFITDEGENPLYITFDNGYSVQRNDGAIVLKGTDEANDAGDLGVRYSNELHGKDGKCQVSIAISSGGENRTETIRDILFYECNMDELKVVYDVLRENLMNVNKVRNGYVEGHISVKDTDKILFTSIPYDQGWKMTSDLEGTEMVPILDGAFIGVKFSNPGEYMLTWQYTVPGLKVGIMISLISLFVIGFVITSEQIIKKK